MVHLIQITKHYGSHFLYQKSNFQIRPFEKIGLVGPNGSGKTTLFRIIMKQERPDEGTVSISEKCIFGYFSQDCGEMKGRSALEEVLARAGRISDLAIKIETIEKRLQSSEIESFRPDEMQVLLEQYGEAQLEFEQRGGYDLDSKAKAILTGLGIGPEDFIRPVESFSGGWKMRIALAGILLLNPDVLLMDEPTNHLDLESIIWLEAWLIQFKGALVMISHDQEFMNRIVTRIIEIANKTITSFSGNYHFYLKEKEIRKNQLLAAYQKQQEMLAKEEEFIARFSARASHAAQVQSRIKKIEKIDRIEIPVEEKTMRLEFPPPPRSGNDVIKFDQLCKSWPLGNNKIKSIFSQISGVIKRLDKIAVIGVNGAGKSTLLKILCEKTDPTSGSLTMGSNVKIGYFSQYSLEVLSPGKTLYEEVHDQIPTATLGFIRNLLGAFLFSGDEISKKISSLSGGEKSRTVLATLLAQPLNLLILDEPTNHLDIQSREVLMRAVQRFEGTVLVVSHDRNFLKKTTNRVFEVSQGSLHIYEGSYQDYLSRNPISQ